MGDDGSIESQVRDHLAAVLQSRIFDSSPRYSAILTYLVDRSLKDESPHEIDIAVDCLRKNESYDPTESSAVRVSVHQLRKKLKQYYEECTPDSPIRFTIPKGSYRVSFGKPVLPDRVIASEASTRSQGLPRGAFLLAIGLLAVSVLVSAVVLISGREQPVVEPRSTPDPGPVFVWNDLAEGTAPILIALGDLFFYTEPQDDSDFPLFIRDVAINSPEELRTQKPAAFRSTLRPWQQSYLPRSTALALESLLPYSKMTGKTVSIEFVSEIMPEDLRNHHVIYVGFVRSMGVLREYFFRSSSFCAADTAVTGLCDKDTGDTYTRSGNPYYHAQDYGVFAKMTGPGGNEVLFFTGLHDAGVLHAVRALTEPLETEKVQQALQSNIGAMPSHFELLFQVSGYNRSDLGATIKEARKLPHLPGE